MLRQARRTALRATAAVSASLVAVELTTHLPTQGRSSDFYVALSDKVGVPAARLLLDPETAHTVALEMTRRGWGPTYRDKGGPRGFGGGIGGGAGFGRRANMSSAPFSSSPSAPSETNQPRPKVKHLVFANPVGLAAGFDKDASSIAPLFELGFGSVEIGTVTPLPQPGNPKPRMWRLVEDDGAINRYGFNSSGMESVAARLRRFRNGGGEEENGEGEGEGEDAVVAVRERSNPAASTEADDRTTLNGQLTTLRTALSAAGHATGRAVAALATMAMPPAYGGAAPSGVLGVNLGKNKLTPDDDALSDYVALIRTLGPYADYLVVNVSSPNTPGLRGLQRRDALRDLLRGALEERDHLASASNVGDEEVPPLLVKIAPDLSPSELEDVASVAAEVGIDGLVVSNTSTSRPPALASKYAAKPGGLSGAPIRDLSTETIRTMFALTDGQIPIIGVGGVGSGNDAYDKIRAGASLVQVYTMMVYEGPGVVGRIRDELEECLVRNGHRTVEDAVGVDHGDIYWRRREEKARRESGLAAEATGEEEEKVIVE